MIAGAQLRSEVEHFWRRVGSAWERRGSITMLPWMVLGVGLVGTAVICEQTRRFGLEQHHRIESTLRDSVVDALKGKLETDLAILSAVAGFFNGSKEVNRDEFKTFYESIALNTAQLKGVQGVGFSRWIPASELKAYEQRIRQEGFPGFHVRPTGDRAHYSSIEFLEPFDWRNQRAFGFDMYSEPVRRQAMERARKTGLASLSGKVRLVQETEEDFQRGVLIYVPIYSDHGHSEDAGSRPIVGWAYSPLRMNDLVNSAIAGIDNPSLSGSGVLVFDGDQPVPGNLLFDNLKLFRTSQRIHASYEPVQVAGHSWLVGVQLSSSQVSPDGLNATFWINLLLGLSVSSIAALMTQILASNHLATRQALAMSEAAVAERALASTVFQESGQGIVVSNPDGRIVMANSAFCQLTGYRISEIKGQHTSLLKSGRQDPAFYQQVWHHLIHKGYWEGDIWNRIRSGEVRCHHLSISTVRDEKLEPVFYVGMYQDVTERHQQEQRVKFLAEHDALTGLANRVLLMEQLEYHFSLARRHGHGLGLLYLDLDGFKPVNDHMGHHVGDQILKILGERFNNVTRKCDLVSRIGGDEFVVLVPIAGQIDELQAMAWKLVKASQEPFTEIDCEISLSVSIGIARFPDHANNPDQLIAAADSAMYAAKGSDAEPVQIYMNRNPNHPPPRANGVTT